MTVGGTFCKGKKVSRSKYDYKMNETRVATCYKFAYACKL